MDNNLLSLFKKEVDLNYNDIEWKLIFEISLDNVYFHLFNINSYQSFKNNFSFEIINQKFNIGFNKKHIIELFLNIIKEKQYIIIESKSNINLILKNEEFNLIKSNNFDKEIIKILIKENEKLNKEKKEITNELVNKNNEIDQLKKEINLYKLIRNNNDINFIITKYDIKKDDINKKTKIINYNHHKGDKHKNVIIESCEIFFNNKKIDFSFEYVFEKEGEYTFQFYFNKNLNDSSFLFHECKTLIYVDLSHFISKDLIYTNSMFYKCSSLEFINFTNFNTENVVNMRSMFFDCSSLIELDLSNFNIKNVNEMSLMFSYCSSLETLNLSNFHIENVADSGSMFIGVKKDINIITNDQKLLNKIKR